MPDYIKISRSEYRAMLAEVRRGMEICNEVADLRLSLQKVLNRLRTRFDAVAIAEMERAVESCDTVARLRPDFVALDRRLSEFDRELTPIRPPSRTDVERAFENSLSFENPFERED